VNLRIVTHRRIPEDDSTLLRQWNDLVVQMERPEVFYTCEWALAVQAAYHASLRPLLFLGYMGDDLIGVASLATDLDERNVTLLAATTADYCEFLAAPENRAEFVGAVLMELAKTRMKNSFVTLANLPETSATRAALLTAAQKHGYRAFLRPAYLCAQIELGSGEQRLELRSALAGKKKLRRYIRGMENEGPVRVGHLQSQAEIQAALPGFADAHVARFQATQRVSSLSTPERRFFLEELARRFSGSRVVTLSTLTINDRPVAWNYGFQFHGSWFWYQPTFDSRQEENSPGYCLLSKIVIEACDKDEMKLVDLGLGAEGYKERFGNSVRQTLHATLTKSWSRHLREVARYRAASLLKRSPKAESAVRGLLSRFSSAPPATPRRKNI
jgi:CelD/BcsL family acetyltransferase involved in cellulose biosynthesis